MARCHRYHARRGRRSKPRAKTFSDDLTNEVPHIDAGEVKRCLEDGRGFVGLRFGLKPAGLVKVKLMPATGVELSWSSNGGRAWDSQLITLTRFTHDGEDHVCFNCEQCDRPRKRLFLVRDGRNPIARMHAFLCIKCGSLGSLQNVGRARKRRADFQATK
jgi:hypothetical protein